MNAWLPLYTRQMTLQLRITFYELGRRIDTLLSIIHAMHYILRLAYYICTF